MSQRPVVPAELTHGPFTVADAERVGLTWKRLQGASWRRLGGGLYAWAELGEGPGLVLAAVQRRLPSGAALSGPAAGWVYGLDLPPCSPVHVTIPPDLGPSMLAGISVHRAALSAEDVVRQRQLTVTSPLRTVVDLGRRLPQVEAVAAVDMALHGRLVTLSDLRAHLSANARGHGVRRLREVIELAEPAAESPMETRLRLLLVQAGLPRPRAQCSLHDDRRRFLGRPDLYYPAERPALEYDGGTHRDSLVEDSRRQNRLVNAGVRLLRFTATDLRNSPDAVVEQVRRALNGRFVGKPPNFPPIKGRFAGKPP